MLRLDCRQRWSSERGGQSTMPKSLAVPIALLVAVGLGAGCTFSPARHQVPFNEADYAPFAIDGTAVITGTAVATLKDGQTITALNEFVFLIPGAAYSREWFEQEILAEHRIEGIDPRSLRFTRSATTDDKGRFTFSNVPPGDYYLTCTITWTVPSFNVRTLEVKRGVSSLLAYATVQVGQGEQTS